ncbi:MAG: hypothetical protein IPO78_17395 [Saprospiraceae bacterium]|nr:hypothetical protein [Saprospiraceae bacterium]
MPGRKKKKHNQKRTESIRTWISNDELASICKLKSLPYYERVRIGKRKATIAMRRTLDELLDVPDNLAALAIKRSEGHESIKMIDPEINL